MKNLKGRPLKANKQANRGLREFVDLDRTIPKRNYRKELSKISDRFVPALKSYSELECLLQFLEGDLSLREGVLEVKKITNA
jgi:hypothetical protein